MRLRMVAIHNDPRWSVSVISANAGAVDFRDGDDDIFGGWLRTPVCDETL